MANSSSVVVNASRNELEASVNGFADMMDRLTGGFRDTMDKLSGSYRDAVERVTDYTGSFDPVRILGDVEKYGNGLGELAGFDYDFGAFGDLYDGINDFSSMKILDSSSRIMGLGVDTDKVENWITEKTGLSMEQIDGYLLKGIDFLADWLKDLNIDFGKMGESIKNVAQKIGKELNISDAGKAISDMVKKITGGNFDLSGIGKMAGNLWDKITGGGLDLSGVGDFFRNLVSGLGGLNMDFSGIGDFFRNLASNFGGGMDFSKFKDFFGNLFNWDLSHDFPRLKEFFDYMMNEGYQIVEDFLTQVLRLDLDGIVGDFFGVFNDGFKKVFDTLIPKDFTASGLKDYIKNLGPGLLGAISEMGSGLGGWAGGVLQSLKDGVRVESYLPNFVPFALDQLGVSEKLGFEKGVMGDAVNGVVTGQMSYQEAVGSLMGQVQEGGWLDLGGGKGGFGKGILSGKDGAAAGAALGGDLPGLVTPPVDDLGPVAAGATRTPGIPGVEAEEPTRSGGVTMEQFCDKIEIHIESADGKGYDQIEKEITDLLTRLLDNYDA